MHSGSVRLASTTKDLIGMDLRTLTPPHRHMLFSLSIVSCLQVFVILGVLELCLPASLTGAVYHTDAGQVPCWREVSDGTRTGDECYHSGECHPSECRPQGPSSLWEQLPRHPLLLLNGLLNLFYYSGEIFMYHEPLGLVFLVLSSLVGSFLIQPVNAILGNPATASIPPWIVVLGMIGAALCVLEKRRAVGPEEQPLVSVNVDEEEDKPPLSVAWMLCRQTFRVLPAFVVLAVVSSSWFALQITFTNAMQLNVWGYTSIDQILLPVYLISMLLVVSSVPQSSEGFCDMSKGSLREMRDWWALSALFLYRGFINARAMLYFYLAITYDVNLVYLELTLIRVVLSWMGAAVLGLLVPRFIDVSQQERRDAFYWLNLLPKVVGTGLIVTALAVLNL